ncbi:uncharacterized protein LOC141607977 [Silene latifolia]|uniref:uncharacterized protein LOC141607977 n=1 Tax=Silene latifolia TaxID=37657 RepID=UPI003D779F9C
MRKPELSGRMAKWSVHLSGYDLKFKPRTAIKSQALADFVSDFCPALQTQAEQDILSLEEDKGEQVWELHVDGASNAKGAGVGLVLKSPRGDLIVQAVRCEFKATNNEAEYEALILGLKLALDLKIRHLQPATLKSQQEAKLVYSTSSEENTPDWRKPYLDWLENDILPAKKKERHAHVSHQPAEPLHQVISPWPFMKWGMDIVVPLPRAPGNKVYMLAMTDYFSKWIEVESSSQVTETQKSTPRNPQSNGQAKSSNKIIVENLKKKLEEIGGKWAEELPLVLWADKTTPKVATGQTPFSLLFRAEAVIPSKVRVPTHRYGCITEDRNQVEMSSNLDTIDELRTSAQIRMASYRQTVARSYNKNVRVRTLQVGNRVLRKVFQNTKNQQAGKFAYNWEGPYQVESTVGNGAYQLMTMEGQMVPRSWNITHLKKYFI